MEGGTYFFITYGMSFLLCVLVYTFTNDNNAKLASTAFFLVAPISCAAALVILILIVAIGGSSYLARYLLIKSGFAIYEPDKDGKSVFKLKGKK